MQSACALKGDSNSKGWGRERSRSWWTTRIPLPFANQCCHPLGGL